MDGDEQGTNNSMIEYAIVDTDGIPRDNVTINKDTGRLALVFPIDYEGLNGTQGQARVLVEARDLGVDPLNGTTWVTLHVEVGFCLF